MLSFNFTSPFQFAKIIQDMQDFVLHGQSFALTVSSFRAAVKSHVDCAKDVSKKSAHLLFNMVNIDEYRENDNIFVTTRYKNRRFWMMIMNGWKSLPFLQTVFMNLSMCALTKTLSGKGILPQQHPPFNYKYVVYKIMLLFHLFQAYMIILCKKYRHFASLLLFVCW